MQWKVNFTCPESPDPDVAGPPLPVTRMGKTSKATKKFSQNKLQDELKARRQVTMPPLCPIQFSSAAIRDESCGDLVGHIELSRPGTGQWLPRNASIAREAAW